MNYDNDNRNLDAEPVDGHLNHGAPDEFEPGGPPVEPDEGPVPAPIPEDPEHERVVDPAATLAQQDSTTRHPLEVAQCPRTQ